MLKKDTIDEVSSRTDVPRAVVRAVLDAASNLYLDQVSSGSGAVIHGIGKITLSHRPAKKARNIHTGETVLVPARTAPLFRPSSALIKAANGE
jgi:DNA-binding protein HU-beta